MNKKDNKIRVSYTFSPETIYLLKAHINRGEAHSMSELLENIVQYFSIALCDFTNYPYDQLLALGKKLHTGSDEISPKVAERHMNAFKKLYNKNNAPKFEEDKFDPSLFYNDPIDLLRPDLREKALKEREEAAKLEAKNNE